MMAKFQRTRFIAKLGTSIVTKQAGTQRHDVESTLNRCCRNVVRLLVKMFSNE